MMIRIIHNIGNENDYQLKRVKKLAKWFFPSSFFLFLGNWIGQIALNWYAFQINHNAMDLAFINLFRLAPIFLLSVWAGVIADRYSRSTLIKITVSSSFITTAILTGMIVSLGSVSIYVLYVYALIRGTISAIETPVRQAVLPDLSQRLSVSKAVSYHSFILNICRSIGPAVAGFLIGLTTIQWAFIAQTACYIVAVGMSLPLKLRSQYVKEKKGFSLRVALDYFKTHHLGRRMMFTSFLIMATGYSYNTLMPILTDYRFPNNASVFGTAMTISAIGGIIATLLIPKILNHFKASNLYFMSSIIFGLSLILIEVSGIYTLFVVIFLVGLFGQFARTSNRIYFQNDTAPEHRGKILSIVMMDRGMIPFGAMLMSVFTEAIGIVQTFLLMGIATMVIAIVGYLIQILFNGGVKHEH